MDLDNNSRTKRERYYCHRLQLRNRRRGETMPHLLLVALGDEKQPVQLPGDRAAFDLDVLEAGRGEGVREHTVRQL